MPTINLGTVTGGARDAVKTANAGATAALDSTKGENAPVASAKVGKTEVGFGQGSGFGFGPDGKGGVTVSPSKIIGTSGDTPIKVTVADNPVLEGAADLVDTLGSGESDAPITATADLIEAITTSGQLISFDLPTGFITGGSDDTAIEDATFNTATDDSGDLAVHGVFVVDGSALEVGGNSPTNAVDYDGQPEMSVLPTADVMLVGQSVSINPNTGEIMLPGEGEFPGG